MSNTDPPRSYEIHSPEETRRLLHWQANTGPPPALRRSEVEAALHAALPDEIAAEMMRLAKPAIGLWPRRLEGPLPPLASRLGGAPVVPPDFAWPTDPENGEPLIFLAEINCGELRELPGSNQLPDSGMLGFFADENGATALDYGICRVCHWANVNELRSVEPPLVTCKVLPSNTVTLAPIAFRALIDLPDKWSMAVESLVGDCELRERYGAVVNSVRYHGVPEPERFYCGFSKLLGWPSLVQWHDLDTMDAKRDTRLLLQLDDYTNGEERADWGGTGGSIYFTIPIADLRASCFETCDFDRQFT
jgi:hypothetical protein